MYKTPANKPILESHHLAVMGAAMFGSMPDEDMGYQIKWN